MEHIPQWLQYILGSISAVVAITFAVRKYYRDKMDRVLLENTNAARKDFTIEQLTKDAEKSKTAIESINNKLYELNALAFEISRQHEEILNQIIDIKSQLKTKK